MNIGIDGIYATEGNTDGERYARSVIESLAGDYPDSRLFVYTPKIRNKDRLQLIDTLHNVEYRLPAASGFQGNLWRTFGVTNCLQADKIDLYHGLNGVLPLNIASAHVPTVVSIHEPEHTVPVKEVTWLKRTLALHMIGASVREATRVIVYSERTRDELMARYDVDSAKVDILDSVADLSSQLMGIYQKAIDEYNEI